MDVDLEVETAVEDVSPEVSLLGGLVDGLLQHQRLAVKLAADVDVGHVGADGVRRDDHALDQHVGIDVDDLAVLEGPGLRLVGVADQVLRLGGVLGHEAPLDAGRKSGAAAAAQTGGS